MSQDAGDRVGARPLSAFHTADIIAMPEQPQVVDEEEESSTIGITPLATGAISVTTTEEEEEEEEEDENDSQSDSCILMSPFPVFGLLQNPHADPPMSPDTTRLATQQEEQDVSSTEEYHSTPEEDINSQSLPILSASRYDYDVNWDMVGQLRRQGEQETKQEEEGEVNTSMASLAEAAAASMIATNTAEEPQLLRRTLSSRYRSQNEDEQHSEGEAEDDNIESASEMNESTASTSSSSTHQRRRPRPSRTSSAPLTRPRRRRPSTNAARIVEEDSGLRASLDSGMASVRRWIRSRSTSRAARSWQRESSQLQLGEEDLFALTNAGEDPRGVYDDNYYSHHFSSFASQQMGVRQRSLSEPNNLGLRNYFFQRAAGREDTTVSSSSVTSTPLPRRVETNSTTSSMPPSPLSSAALNSSLFHSPQEMAEDTVSSIRSEETLVPVETPQRASASDEDPNRESRTRWLRINRRFQLIITVVAIIFSLLLFAILVCWVVFTSAYVVSIEKKCDVPLKEYFWLATLQLILDVFRTDIMRFVFRWDTHSNEHIPVRVIAYNIAYMIYALLVLRLGVQSVFMADNSTCPITAPELYQSGAAFVTLSIAAWSTIVLGYLVPFCFVATLLTWNGYTPSADANREEAAPGFGGVFPAAYSTSGAPPGCVDQLRTVLLEEFPDDYPHECCICMGEFVRGEVIVTTECHHVFHKRCCAEWLRQARTCPVCRMDIPSSMVTMEGTDAASQVPPSATSRLTRPFPGREDFQQDVVGLLQILRRQEERLRQRNSSSGDSANATVPVSPTRLENMSVGSETEMVAIEEGRASTRRSNTN